jgi:hypothetical protein
MKVIRICTNAKGDGDEITNEMAKHPGWKVAAVFPLGNAFYGEEYRDFFVLITEEQPNLTPAPPAS